MDNDDILFYIGLVVAGILTILLTMLLTGEGLP